MLEYKEKIRNYVAELKNKGQEVLIEPLHKSSSSFLQKSKSALHQIQHSTMKKGRDAFFVMDPNQVDELRHLIKVTRGLSQEEADRISFKYFKRRVRRIVPRPDLLAQRVDFVIRVFEEIDSCTNLFLTAKRKQMRLKRKLNNPMDCFKTTSFL